MSDTPQDHASAAPRDGGRVLVFVVSYNAQDHIRSVLGRLPKEVFNNPSYHVLVIDDCSRDQTAATAGSHVEGAGWDNVTVLRNAVNQGYGGNQKLGFHYAVSRGFDLVVLLHGDGQYAPELVPEFVRLWREKGAGVVLGSRMLDKASALRGRMPLYKWVGNQVLTALQNRIAGTELSEFHTGYRAYDTSLLRRIPFELNTNGFHFDTEILLQAFAAGARVEEFPIPTHYGDEVCHVNGLAYAWRVFQASLEYRFQRIGFFCSMQYRGLLSHEERYADKSGLAGSTHWRVLRRVVAPASVLDVGCGPGFVAGTLSARGCRVTGVDRVRPARFPGERFVEQDLEREPLREDPSAYDYVLLLDVLEHMSDPEGFLVGCRRAMATERRPVFLISTGNVAFAGVRLLLLAGAFTYGERGILDVTHKRLFTKSSFRRLLEETGYEVVRMRGSGVPFQMVLPGLLGRCLGWCSFQLARLWPSLFAYQLVVEARPRTSAGVLLAGAQRFGDAEPGRPA